MAGLRKGIQVTNEFDGYEPPEDTRAYGDAYADDSRMMMAEPEVAYTMEDEEEEKRERPCQPDCVNISKTKS